MNRMPSKSMRLWMWWTGGVMVLAVACSDGLYVPEGDAEAGREVFAALECHHCHEVLGEDFPAPAADPPVPVVLGSPTGGKSRQYLAESIIAPSHRFAQAPLEIVSYDPPQVGRPEYENIREGEESRMGDFNDALTVGEWCDLVAYLESLQARKIWEVIQP